MGGLIKFPRNTGLRADAQWDDREIAPMAARADHDASLIRWADVARPRDDDGGDGGGGAAA